MTLFDVEDSGEGTNVRQIDAKITWHEKKISEATAKIRHHLNELHRLQG